MAVLQREAIEAALAAGAIGVEPIGEGALQPASVDLRLGSGFLVPTTGSRGLRVPHYGDPGAYACDYREGPRLLEPGCFALGETLERLCVGSGHVGEVMGKSSIARRGLFVHVTGGYVDPGYEGRLTLELFNASPWCIELIPGRYVCQVRFQTLQEPTAHPYRSRYRGATGVEGPKV
jgi:dCTP deaminase